MFIYRMNNTSTASLSPSANADATYNTITGGTPGPSADYTLFSTENYPADNVPLMDPSGIYKMPNTANQEIFKNLPLSWWVSSINTGTVQYRPVSNTVNWAYVTPEANDIHILYDISTTIIPNKTATATIDDTTGNVIMILEDNNYLNMTRVMMMPWMRKPPPIQSVTGVVGSSEPAASEPTASEPAASEPATSEPATSEPAATE